MDALHILEQEHRAVDALFEKLEGTYAKPANEEQASATRGDVFARLRRALETHALIEERAFYPALKAAPATQDLVTTSYREHQEVKRLLHEMSQADLQRPVFATLLEDLKRSVQHHVQEEEQLLFPRVREILSEAQLDELGSRLQRERADIEKTELAEARRGAPKTGIINSNPSTGPAPHRAEAADRAPAIPVEVHDDYELGSERDSAVRKEHRASPGSRDTGRKGGSSTTEKVTPRAGRSSH